MFQLVPANSSRAGRQREHTGVVGGSGGHGRPRLGGPRAPNTYSCNVPAAMFQPGSSQVPARFQPGASRFQPGSSRFQPGSSQSHPARIWLPSCSHPAPILLPSCSHPAPILLPSCSHRAPILLPCCFNLAPILLQSCSHPAPILLPSCSHRSSFLCSYSSYTSRNRPTCLLRLCPTVGQLTVGAIVSTSISCRGGVRRWRRRHVGMADGGKGRGRTE
jgi:hypothetical protein